MLEILAFFDLFLMALITGISFSHLLQRGPKSELPGPQFLAVQQILLRHYGAVVGGLEVTAFLLALLLAVFVRARPELFYLAAGAAACLALMIAIWAMWINGINKTVNSWTRDSLPANWGEFRDRWHALHAARLALGLIGLGALIILALRLGCPPPEGKSSLRQGARVGCAHAAEGA
jgi:hypothetical protein